MIATAPGIFSLAAGHWQPAPALDAAAVLALGLYAWGAARVGSWPLWRGACFAAGVATVLVASQSGLDAYDDRLLSAHMVQHLLLLTLAPALLLAGHPLLLALRGLPPARRRAPARLLARARPLGRPGMTLAVFALVVPATHLRVFYEATLSHPLLHDSEHVAYLLAGLMLFAPLLDADPGARRRLDGLGRLVYLLAASPPMALLGAYLNRATGVVYPSYAAPSRALGVAPVFDQHQAGAIMWVGGAVVMIAVGLWSAVAAMVREERRLAAREQRALAAGAAAVTAPRSEP